MHGSAGHDATGHQHPSLACSSVLDAGRGEYGISSIIPVSFRVPAQYLLYCTRLVTDTSATPDIYSARSLVGITRHCGWLRT
jgi:hypothetical protein